MKYVDKTDDCWLWTGSKRRGYGQFKYDGTMWHSHRLMYLYCYGFLTPGLEICHTCRNKCVNPDHLEEKTHSENMADRVRDGTDARGEKCCAAKLTDAQVLEIRNRGNETQRKLSAEFGVSHVVINHIRNRKIWKHI